MITSEIYYGSGIGNQIWYYIVTRLMLRGMDIPMESWERTDGKVSYLLIDFGEEVIGGSGPEGGPRDPPRRDHKLL